jgi:hypothetical protein
MFTFLQILVLTLLLIFGQEVLRRSKPWAVWGLFLLLPVLLAPYWIQINTLGFFPWLKGYSVFIAVCWVTVLRFTKLGKQDWARSAIPLLLAANIFEAVAVDLIDCNFCLRSQLHANRFSELRRRYALRNQPALGDRLYALELDFYLS